MLVHRDPHMNVIRINTPVVLCEQQKTRSNIYIKHLFVTVFTTTAAAIIGRSRPSLVGALPDPVGLSAGCGIVYPSPENRTRDDICPAESSTPYTASGNDAVR